MVVSTRCAHESLTTQIQYLAANQVYAVLAPVSCQLPMPPRRCTWPFDMIFQRGFIIPIIAIVCKLQLVYWTGCAVIGPVCAVQVSPSTGSPILLLRREAGVILTPRILWCILLVLSGVPNANQLISLGRGASSIILLPPPEGIAIHHVCWLVRSCVREHVLGPNILKTVGDSRSVTIKHL